MGFLPLYALKKKWGECERPDFVYVCGDAYVDHPSFGAAIICRVLESKGFSVAFIAQPDYKSTDDIKAFGKPRLGFLVSSGNIDSMVATLRHRKSAEATTIILPTERAVGAPTER